MKAKIMSNVLAVRVYYTRDIDTIERSEVVLIDPSTVEGNSHYDRVHNLRNEILENPKLIMDFINNYEWDGNEPLKFKGLGSIVPLDGTDIEDYLDGYDYD